MTTNWAECCCRNSALVKSHRALWFKVYMYSGRSSTLATEAWLTSAFKVWHATMFSQVGDLCISLLYANNYCRDSTAFDSDLSGQFDVIFSTNVTSLQLSPSWITTSIRQFGLISKDAVNVTTHWLPAVTITKNLTVVNQQQGVLVVTFAASRMPVTFACPLSHKSAFCIISFSCLCIISRDAPNIRPGRIFGRIV